MEPLTIPNFQFKTLHIPEIQISNNTFLVFSFSDNIPYSDILSIGCYLQKEIKKLIKTAFISQTSSIQLYHNTLIKEIIASNKITQSICDEYKIPVHLHFGCLGWTEKTIIHFAQTAIMNDVIIIDMTGTDLYKGLNSLVQIKLQYFKEHTIIFFVGDREFKINELLEWGDFIEILV